MAECGRCEHCVYWEREECRLRGAWAGHWTGTCTRERYTDVRFESADPNIDMITRADFGCVQWEPKGE